MRLQNNKRSQVHLESFKDFIFSNILGARDVILF